MPKIKNQPSHFTIICQGCNNSFIVSYKCRAKKFCNSNCYRTHAVGRFKRTDEQKHSLSERFSGTGNPMHGSSRIFSIEHRKKIGDAARNKPKSAEFKRRVSEGWKKKIANGYKTWNVGTTAETDERQKRRSEAAKIALQNKKDWNAWNKGKTTKTDERVARNAITIGKALKGIPHSLEHIEKCRLGWLKKFNEDKSFKTKMISIALSNREKSKFFNTRGEQVLRKILPQRFEQNCRIESFQVDFLDKASKEIVEYYGKFMHLDPRHFLSDYYDSWRGLYAKDKWNSDQKRISVLTQLGYKVFVIWEDDLNHNKIPFEILA